MNILRELTSAEGAERLAKILAAGFEPAPQGRYLHWDKLRRLDPPEGLSHEDWWFAIKLSRRPYLRSFSLVDARGEPFKYAIPDIAIQLIHEIDRDASGQIATPQPVTNPSTRNYYLVSSLIEEAITSSQLEGAATTRRVAKEMLQTGRAPRDHSEKMIFNNFRAMNFMREHVSEPLSQKLIFELHRILTEGTLDAVDAAGRFRRPDEDIRIEDEEGTLLHRPPPADQLATRLDQLCAFASEEEPFVHPIVRSILIHFWLAYDHPFTDGNGRTARALFYWSMLKRGYWLAEFLSISRILRAGHVKYARSFLYVESDDNDATYFLLAQLAVIKQAITDLHAYLKRKVEEIHATEALLRRRATSSLNQRQIALLSHALKHASYTYTIEGHAQSYLVSYMTARSDLLGLERRKLLSRVKRGKTFQFFPVEGLAERLKKLK